MSISRLRKLTRRVTSIASGAPSKPRRKPKTKARLSPRLRPIPSMYTMSSGHASRCATSQQAKHHIHMLGNADGMASSA